MNTNAVVGFGDDIPGLNALPESMRQWLVIALVVSPYLTRAFYAVKGGGGIKGIFTAIWLGTNTPKSTEEEA